MKKQVHITQHYYKSKRHTTAYLSAGASDSPLLFFIHSWVASKINFLAQKIRPDAIVRGYFSGEKKLSLPV